MSRIRTIKPEFWVSEQVILCSPLARLLFIGMWNFCDDSGIHPASCIRLKAEVFPGDTISPDEIRRLVDELLSNGLLDEYRVDDKAYWQVTGWEHQKIDKANYKYPNKFGVIPSRDSENADKYQKNNFVEQCCETEIRQPVDDSSTTPHPRKGKERKGRESNGKELINISPAAENHESTSPNEDVQDIFKFWQDTMQMPKAKLDGKRRRRIQDALKRYSKADLCKAITGCSLTPFNMGENEQNQKYNDIELILRDSSRVDRFIQNFYSPPKKKKRDALTSQNVDVAKSWLSKLKKDDDELDEPVLA